ncbi:MAG: hypothetical protein V4509_03790 [Patescibacteria group bacterium]
MRYIYTLTSFILFFAQGIVTYGADSDNAMFTSGVPTPPSNFSSFTCIVIKLSLDFIPYLVVIALGAFLQGLIKYVSHGDDSEKMSEGRKMMIYGIVGFFFMVSIWGMLGLFTQSFGISLVIPQFKSDLPFACN